jgi:threonine synthase
MPVAGGALYLGAWLGFLERRVPGLTSRLPRLHMAQADGCAPLAAAADRGLDDAAPIEPRPTVAGGIEIPRPPRAKLLLEALRKSGGSAVAMSDAAILEAQAELARTEGIYCEPTSATAFAALIELGRRGLVGRGERVVVAVTGSGLKGGS